MRDDPTIAALLARSNRLGADKRVTNFAGGNTSAKLTTVSYTHLTLPTNREV